MEDITCLLFKSPPFVTSLHVTSLFPCTCTAACCCAGVGESLVGVHFIPRVSQPRLVSSPAGREMGKWHSLSCSCLNKHHIFKFVYFNIKKGDSAADTFIVQPYSWRLSRHVEWHIDTFHSLAVELCNDSLHGIWIQSVHKQEMYAGFCDICLDWMCHFHTVGAVTASYSLSSASYSAEFMNPLIK